MIKRVLAALVATLAFGALASPAAEAAGDGGPVGKPKTDCIWVWTVKGPACHWE